MPLDFDIRRSDKAYLESPEKFIVSRDGTVFLRVLGEEPRYEFMTATASEDTAPLKRVADQERLLVAALKTAELLGVTAKAGKDWKSREYVKICALEYISDAYRAAETSSEFLTPWAELTPMTKMAYVRYTTRWLLMSAVAMYISATACGSVVMGLCMTVVADT